MGGEYTIVKREMGWIMRNGWVNEKWVDVDCRG